MALKSGAGCWTLGAASTVEVEKLAAVARTGLSWFRAAEIGLRVLAVAARTSERRAKDMLTVEF